MRPRLQLDITVSELWTAIFTPMDTAPCAEGPIRTQEGVFLVPALSVRTLWDALLWHKNSQGGGTPRSQIVMSAVNIAAMTDLVREWGFDPCFVDLELQTLFPTDAAWQARLSLNTAMVLAGHIYGARQPVAQLGAACRQVGALLVEDCAQAFDGQLQLAEGADVALYSFGPIKRWTALGGAVGVFRCPDLARAISDRLLTYPRRSDAGFRQRALKYLGLRLMSQPWIYGGLVAGLQLLGQDVDRVIGGLARGFSVNQAASYRFQMAGAQARFLKARLSRAHQMTDQAPGAVALASRVFGPVWWDQRTGFGVPGQRAPSQGWWLFPVLCEDPNQVMTDLRRAGFDATRGATSLRAHETETRLKTTPQERADEGLVVGDCPNAQWLLDRVVYLPTPLPKPGDHAFTRLTKELRRLSADQAS